MLPTGTNGPSYIRAPFSSPNSISPHQNRARRIPTDAGRLPKFRQLLPAILLRRPSPGVLLDPATKSRRDPLPVSAPHRPLPPQPRGRRAPPAALSPLCCCAAVLCCCAAAAPPSLHGSPLTAPPESSMLAAPPRPGRPCSMLAAPSPRPGRAPWLPPPTAAPHHRPRRARSISIAAGVHGACARRQWATPLTRG
jgi:hypothetical protein